MDEIKVDGHVLRIDRDATYNYHDMFNEKCSCCYCCNFFAGFSRHYSRDCSVFKVVQY